MVPSPIMMVDWISAFCEAREWVRRGMRVYDTGRVLLVKPGGEVERQASRGVLLEGSYDSRLLLRSFSGADLYLSGNPVKHLQGHNLFGPADPVRLFFDAGWAARKAVGLFPSSETWRAAEFAGPRFTRIDLTRSYRFRSAKEARAWLRFVAGSARSRHGGALYDNGTVYFGKGSERWTFKLYHKADELAARGKAHKLPESLRDRERLFAWAVGVVRFELTLRSKELEKVEWSTFDARRLWEEYYGKVTWNQNVRMVEADMLEQELAGELRRTLTVWRCGVDPRGMVSKATFYRHRRALLDALGVDIAEAPPPASAVVDVPASLDPAGWDPEPLEGYAWDPENERQRKLV